MRVKPEFQCIMGRLLERSAALHEQLKTATQDEAKVIYQVMDENRLARSLVMRAARGMLICEGVQATRCDRHTRFADAKDTDVRHALWGKLRVKAPHLAKNLDALSHSALNELAAIVVKPRPKHWLAWIKEQLKNKV